THFCTLLMGAIYGQRGYMRKITLREWLQWGYRLDFGHWTQRWIEASAITLPDEGSYVFGVLWELNQSDQPPLDKQEAQQLTVETVPDRKKVSCMVYRIRDDTRQKSVEAHGANLIPSLRYKNVII
ncbi:Gamma-glutamylcyclotransferase, partial [Orchesella cincta]